MPRRLGRLPARGLIAATFGFLTLSAVVAGIINFSRPHDDFSPIGSAFTPLVLWTVVFGFVTYKTFTGRLFAGHLWTRFDRALVDAGFRPATKREVEQTAGLPVLLLSPAVLRMDSGGGVDHVCVGSVGGREVRVFRAHPRRWCWQLVRRSRCRGAGPAHLARTIIRPARRGLRPPIAMKRVTYELERFNRSIEVRSVDRFFATAIIDPRMIEWLERRLRATVIELADGWVVAWSNALRGRPASPLELIESLAGFSDHIPRSIPSFFPMRSDSLRWVHRRKRGGLSGWLDRLTNVDAPGDKDRRVNRSRVPQRGGSGER